MDKGAWWAAFHRVAESRMRLSAGTEEQPDGGCASSRHGDGSRASVFIPNLHLFTKLGALRTQSF